MKKPLLLFLLITILSCKEKFQAQSFEGDIYITLINLYNVNTIVPKDKIEEFKKNIINFNPEGKSESEKEMTKYYKTLIDYNLFDKSNFQIKLKNNDIINVYIDDNKFLELRKELKNLDRDKEKITVKFQSSKISDGVNNRAIYSAFEITSIKKTAGKTDWRK